MPTSEEDLEDGHALSETMPAVPDDYIYHIRNEVGLRESTIDSYSSECVKFLFFVQRRMKRPAVLEDCWNYDLVRKFFEWLKKVVCSATVSNHHSCQKSIREFLKFHGRRPANFSEIDAKFKVLAKSARRSKRQYVQEKLVEKSSKRSLLGEVYRDVYHADPLRSWFHEFIEGLKISLEEDEEIVIHPKDFALATAFMLIIIVAANFKRTSNLSMIPLNAAKRALNNALREFRRKNPGVSLSSLPRRLDQDNCVPAVIEIANSAKKGDIELICILSARDQKALLLYEEYVRKYCPVAPPQGDDHFFLSNSGQPLTGKQAGHLIHWIGEKCGIADLTVSSLRAEIETENFVYVSEEAANVSRVGLNHSIPTALEYYVSKTRRHAVSSSLRMNAMFEDCGERVWNEAAKASYDPVSKSSCNPELSHSNLYINFQ